VTGDKGRKIRTGLNPQKHRNLSATIKYVKWMEIRAICLKGAEISHGTVPVGAITYKHLLYCANTPNHNNNIKIVMFMKVE
jgi:hypothetical protein